MRLRQQLLSEGASAEVQAVARFTDGTRQAIPLSQMLVESLSSDLGVQLDAASGRWGVSVLIGAARACGSLVNVSWNVCGSVVASGLAPVHLQLPNAISMAVSVDASRLTSPDDSAAVAPISVGYTAAVRVRVSFDDGTIVTSRRTPE